MPTYDLGTRTLAGTRFTFQTRLVYVSETDSLTLRKPDNTEFDHPITMDQDTAVASNKSLLTTTLAANVSNVTAGILEEAARLTFSVAGVEVMRFRPPAHVDHGHGGGTGSPNTGAPPPGPPPPPPGVAAPFPMPRVRLADLRAGGALANANDAFMAFVEDAPSYSPGLYLRKAGSWLTWSGVMVSGASI